MKLQRLFFFLLALGFSQFILQTPTYGAGSPEEKSAEQANAAVQQESASPALPADAGLPKPVDANSGSARDAQASVQGNPGRSSFLLQWLHMLDQHEVADIEDSSVVAYLPRVPGDLARIFTFPDRTGETGHATGLFGIFWRTVVAICLAALVVFAIRRIALKIVDQFEQITPPGNDALASLWAGVLRTIPGWVGLLVFTLSAIIIFLSLAGDITIEARMLFQVVLGTVVACFTCLMLSRIIFAPDHSEVRPLAMQNNLAKPLHRALVTSFSVFMAGSLFIRLIMELGAQAQTISWVIITLGSTVIAVFIGLIIYLKRPVSISLQAQIDDEDDRWIAKQLATYWHVPAFLYLFIVWFIWVGRELTETMVRNGSFIISLLIVPIYLVLSHAGHVVIAAIVDSLGLGAQGSSDGFTGQEEVVDEQEIINRKKAIVSKAGLVFKLVLVATLAIWLFSLWGYRIPFAERAVRAIFESLVALSLALITWRYASSYIEKKISEATPPPSEKELDMDDEFGGAVPRGRSFTLLPMLRKVIGSILVVMVSLIVISSLGVNIGPLLAGAGVIGLAVGFGAQKLVSDVLSGFFFLLDDAFRVGEYIQTGSIRGTVENITLRNVMLRHHLGMLQIVPHSDLGGVTNFMRGGIVIKFPLEFSYDTDIEKVRKIIKKVGQEMLVDEELADDFIQPIKSQGVYGISNSVMVIRVKFTAKPGKQFVIKREAFRRITEALNAKGIHYAHRKVIVDFPDTGRNSPMDHEAKVKALQAGGAVGAMLAAEAEAEAKRLAEEDKEK